ncbi:hypothetical protein DL93DRAFT_2089779 [Clavulina sp. PMI_390]|nr:hypothetical protein DL93DRAFT_2089779 [Clavulina sp. PMI_390]
MEDRNPGLAFLTSQRFPALRHLEVQRAQLALPNSILGQLEHLKLDTVPMPTIRYHNMFRLASSLKSLVIDNVNEANFTESDVASTQEAYILPHLETIQLSSNPSLLVEMIFQSCRCPSLLTLQLSDVTDQGFDPDHAFLSSLGSFLTHAPKLRDLIITESNDEEICLLTTPLRTHAFQLKRLIFSTWDAMKVDSALLPHLNTTLALREEAGASPLELETFKESLPILQEAVHGAHLVASERPDCTTGDNGLGTEVLQLFH